MRVMLAGEGKTELGEWAKEREYRELPGEKGVLLALLEGLGGSALEVVDAVRWCKIRKYRAGGHASAEERNVLGLALAAGEARCQAVFFSRDRDGDQDREADLETGLGKAAEAFGDLAFAGGVAIENVEAWILVLCGAGGEALSGKQTKEELSSKFSISTLEEMVALISRSDLGVVKAGSLARWLSRAREAMG